MISEALEGQILNLMAVKQKPIQLTVQPSFALLHFSLYLISY